MMTGTFTPPATVPLPTAPAPSAPSSSAAPSSSSFSSFSSFSAPPRANNEYLLWPRVSMLDMEPLPMTVSSARVHTRRVLKEWHLPGDIAFDAETLAAELTSNALRATLALGLGLSDPPPLALRLLSNHERLVIEAWDCHPGVPERGTPAPGDQIEKRTHGLSVVEALSNRWGYRRLTKNIKIVWCELHTQGQRRPRHGRTQGRTECREGPDKIR